MAVSRTSADAAEADLVKEIDESDAKVAGRIRLGAINIINSAGQLDPRVKAMLKLGRMPGGPDVELTDEDKAEIARYLGLGTTTNGTIDDAAPKLKGYLPSYEHDGSPTGSGFKSEEDAKANGYEVWLDTDGSQKGWRKPAPKPIAAGSAKVTVVDRKGTKTGEIDLDEYKKHPDWFEVKEYSTDRLTPIRVHQKRHR